MTGLIPQPLYDETAAESEHYKRRVRVLETENDRLRQELRHLRYKYHEAGTGNITNEEVCRLLGVKAESLAKIKHRYKNTANPCPKAVASHPWEWKREEWLQWMEKTGRKHTNAKGE